MSTLQLRRDSLNARGALSPSGILTALTLFLGVAGSFFARFAEGLSAPLLAGAALILVLPPLCKTRHGGKIAFLALCAGFAYSLFFLDLAGGLCAELNSISASFGERMAYNLPRVSASEAALPVAIVWTALLIALMCLWMARTRAALFGWLIALMLFLPDWLLGMRSPSVCIAALVCGLILLRLPERPRSRGLFAALCVALALATAVAPIGAFEPLNALHDAANAWIQTARFGDRSDMSLPQGDFAQLSHLRKSDASMLEITMSRPESLYLRGYVGSEYAQNAWKAAAPESLWDGAELFYWLHRDGFYGQTQLAALSALLDGAGEAIDIQIRHLGAPRDVIYAPYELISLNGSSPDSADIGDIRLRNLSLRGLSSYMLQSASNQVKRYATLARALSEREAAGDEAISAYLTDESHYNRFVYAHFLEIPDELRACLAELLGEYSHPENAHMDYAQAKSRVLEWLNTHCEYAEGTSFSGADFIESFLTQSQSGGDAHYAAATVMMMRYFGIPARYVEGYLITPERAENAQPGVSFTLTASDAHAWAEIYQDGVGWIPFETAPGYLNLMEREDALSGTGTQDSSAADAPSETPPNENSLDMTEDLSEDPDEQQEPPLERLTPIFRLLLRAAPLLLALVLLILFLRRQIRRAALKHRFRLKDRRRAVQNLYEYLFDLLRTMYRWPNCVSPSGFEPTVRADLGDDMAAKYHRAIEICSRAAFSEGEIAESDYRFVYNFVQKTRALARKRLPLPKRWKL